MPWLIYKTSKEKWEKLAEIADNHFKDSELARLCRDVAEYIEEKGDASLAHTVTFEIGELRDFLSAIFNGEEHPCPHCMIYYKCEAPYCRNCPLFDGEDGLCCFPWRMVRKYLERKVLVRW